MATERKHQKTNGNKGVITIEIKLRDYQQECVDIIDNLESGAYLVVCATGLGKTVIFTNIKRKGRMLILSHREELVRQPLKYFTCSTGVEMASESSHGEEVVSASVQSLVRRLESFDPDAFDMIIVDEAHHASAQTYRKILDYFNPRLVIGFTATPNRADGVRLNDVFEKIIFKRDLKWGIKNNYLCDIDCKRVDIGYDLSEVHTRMGDYAPGELADAMEGTEDAIAEAYKKLAKGATLIFACNVAHAEAIASRINGAVAVTGKTENRSEIIERFTRREIPCLSNCMVFTEGTDMPLVETVMIARPTQSDSLYTQMVGRGLRLHPEKDKLLLVDCVGITGKRQLCTAPSLLGIDISEIPKSMQKNLEGDLFDLPDKATMLSDNPVSWVKNVQNVNIWAQEYSYNTHNLNLFRMPDGSLRMSLPDKVSYTIPCPDELGFVTLKDGTECELQEAIDLLYERLKKHHADSELIWNLDKARLWSDKPATENQIELIRKRLKKLKFDCSELDIDNLTRFQASQILNRVMG